MICTIILAVVTCTAEPAVKVGPVVAAEMLKPREFVYVPKTPRYPVPATSVAPKTPPQPERPARRLDGSLWTDPPWTAVAIGEPVVHVNVLPRR